MKGALKGFGEIHRRLEVKWDGAIKLIDDYGHHPTEINNPCCNQTNVKSRIVVVFQPHRYTRTKALMEEFLTSFNEADVLILTEIYAASEKIEGVDGHVLSGKIRTSGHKNVVFAPNKEDAAEKVLNLAREGM